MLQAGVVQRCPNVNCGVPIEKNGGNVTFQKINSLKEMMNNDDMEYSGWSNHTRMFTYGVHAL